MDGTSLAIDIETVGLPWEELDQAVRKYLKTRGDGEQTEEDVKQSLALNPGTGKIVAIGLWRPEEDKGGVLMALPSGAVSEPSWEEFSDRSSIYRGSERQVLREFWRYVGMDRVGRLVTFNGRVFDGPFLMLRSSILGIRPTRNFVPYRYDFRRHCDLAEVVSFYRSRPLETLDFWCRQAGIESPKKQMEGNQVEEFYESERYDQIATYCLGDARATAELFEVLKPVVQLMDSD